MPARADEFSISSYPNMSKKLIKVVAGIIHNEKNQIFLVQRPKHDPHLALKWEFPGGKIEKNETPEQALKRELLEELNIEVEIEALFTQVSHSYSHLDLEMLGLACRWTKGELFLREHAAGHWLQKAEISKYDLAPADIPLFANYLQWKLK